MFPELIGESADTVRESHKDSQLLGAMMNQRIIPTSVERVMREEDFIVSMTDLKGLITYGNRIFIEFSGYTEMELLGTPHSIVRHPDMPRGIFKLL